MKKFRISEHPLQQAQNGTTNSYKIAHKNPIGQTISKAKNHTIVHIHSHRAIFIDLWKELGKSFARTLQRLVPSYHQPHPLGQKVFPS